MYIVVLASITLQLQAGVYRYFFVASIVGNAALDAGSHKGKTDYCEHDQYT